MGAFAPIFLEFATGSARSPGAVSCLGLRGGFHGGIGAAGHIILGLVGLVTDDAVLSITDVAGSLGH